MSRKGCIKMHVSYPHLQLMVFLRNSSDVKVEAFIVVSDKATDLVLYAPQRETGIKRITVVTAALRTAQGGPAFANDSVTERADGVTKLVPVEVASLRHSRIPEIRPADWLTGRTNQLWSRLRLLDVDRRDAVGWPQTHLLATPRASPVEHAQQGDPEDSEHS